MPQSYRIAHLAGLLYVAIIALGLTAEFAIRAPLIGPDAEATASALAANSTVFRLSILADVVMVAADLALALALYLFFRGAAPLLVLFATAFRMMQAAVLAAALILPLAAISLVDYAETAHVLVSLHAEAYDLGLIFFGVNTVLLALVMARATFVPNWLSALMGAAGVVYLIGSTLRILRPDLIGAFEPAYAIALVAELSFTIWLLTRNRGMTTLAV